MQEQSSGLSRGQRWVVAWLTLPITFIAAWVVVSALVFVTPAFWTWPREPTFIEWVIRGIFIAAPFVFTALVGWCMYRWIKRGAASG